MFSRVSGSRTLAGLVRQDIYYVRIVFLELYCHLLVIHISVLKHCYRKFMSLGLNQNVYAQESKEIRQGSPLGTHSLPSLSYANSLIYAGVLGTLQGMPEEILVFISQSKGNFGSRKVEI